MNDTVNITYTPEGGGSNISFAFAPEALTDPLKPPSTLLAKLGSIVHNALLLTGTDHDQYLLGELEKYRHDPEVMQWMAGMDRLNLLPHTT